jgi:hypothetical protein
VWQAGGDPIKCREIKDDDDCSKLSWIENDCNDKLECYFDRTLLNNNGECVEVIASGKTCESISADTSSSATLKEKQCLLTEEEVFMLIFYFLFYFFFYRIVIGQLVKLPHVSSWKFEVPVILQQYQKKNAI